MNKKLKQITTYTLFSFITNVVYGFILYFVFTWLSGYSQLYAYMGNLVLIIAVLAMDEYTLKMLQSEKFVTKLKQEKDPEKSYRFIQQALNNIGSFKADLYLFYVIVLVVSQVVQFYPTLVGENLVNFILANNYSILFLIAFDALIGQFSKDRTKMKNILEKLKQSLDENQG